MATPADILLRARVDDKVSKPLQQINTKINQTTKAGKDLSGQMRLMRGGAGQLGHQVQDVAVQLQMGTDAMIVFGQQGSQVASLFGPKGAMLGGFLAIAAALAGPVINAITGTSGALAKLRDDAKEASGAFADLNRLQKEQRRQEVGTEIGKLLKDRKAQQEALNQAQAEFVRLQKIANQRTDANLAPYQRTTDAIEEAQDTIRSAGKAIYDINAALRELRKDININQEVDDLNASLQTQIDTFGKSEIAIKAQEMALKGMSKERIREFIQLSLTLQSLGAEKELRDSLAASTLAEADATAAALKAETSANLARVSSLETSVQTTKEKHLEEVNFVKQMLEQKVIDETRAQELITALRKKEADRQALIEQKKADKDKQLRKEAIAGVGEQLMSLDASNKKVFRMQKAYRMVEASISAYQAANNALAAPFPFPIPQAMAAAALTFGLANVAQIKAQSFEGGGFTGHGARAGGLDGKGGRMAMIHPNETVIDHSKGGASGVTVINNVDARGSGADVEQKIKSAMAQTSQQTIMTIQDLMRRGRFA